MASFKSDGRERLERARQEPDLRRKTAMLEDALDETLRELEYVLGHLGAENFDAAGLKGIREGMRCLE